MEKLYNHVRLYVKETFLHRNGGYNINYNSHTSIVALCKKHQILRMVMSTAVAKLLKQKYQSSNENQRAGDLLINENMEEANSTVISVSTNSLFHILYLLVHSVKSKRVFDSAIDIFFREFTHDDFFDMLKLYDVLLSRYESTESFIMSYLVILKYYVEKILLPSLVHETYKYEISTNIANLPILILKRRV